MALNIMTFLNRVLPWPGDDEKGFVNIHYAGKFEDGRPWMTGRPTRTPQEFMQYTQEMNTWTNPVDIYFCLSRQSETKPRERDGKIMAVKMQQFALALKAIWLDVDAGKMNEDGTPKGYRTLAEARTGVANLCENAGLPSPSAVVGSGGGLHVYWISKVELKPAEWQFWADALKTVALKHLGADFFDAGCTGDSARILRVPGTFNRKQATPRPVELLELQENDYDFDTDLAVLKTVDTGSSRIVVPAADDLHGEPMAIFADVAIDLGAGVTTEAWIVNLDYVAPQCGFIREALETGGAAFGQPLWNYTNLLATFSTGGREDAHRMARGYPRYSETETDLQFDRKLEERRNSNLGPPGCKAISEAGCTHCASCPLLELGKSPLHHVRIPTADPVVISGTISKDVEGSAPRTIPAAFSGVVSRPRDKNAPPSLTDADLPAGRDGFEYIVRDDIVYKRIWKANKATGEMEPQDKQLLLCNIYEPWTQKEEGEGAHALNFTVSVDKGHYKMCSMSTSQMESSRCNGQLVDQDVKTYQPNKAELGAFFMDWLSKLHNEEVSRDATQMGWHVDRETNKPKGFAYGGTFYGVDGTKSKAGIMDREMNARYTPRGDIAVWFKACKSITDQNRPPVEVLVAAGFASPLMIMTGMYNGMLSCISHESGVYKSTAARTGVAIWGNPKLAAETSQSTIKGALNRAGIIRNLPILWDELQDEDALAKVYQALYLGTLGVEGSRLTSDIKQQRRGEWQLLSMVCANNSFADYVAMKNPSTASGLVRVLEWHPAALPKDDPAHLSIIDAQNMYGSLDYNFGRIGEQFIELVAANYDATYEMVTGQFKEIEVELKLGDRERFWGAMIAAVLVAATIANTLGCEFHVEGIKKHLYDTVAENRKRVIEEIHAPDSPDRVNDVLTGFLKAMRPRTLVTVRDGVNQHMAAHPDGDTPCELQWDDLTGTLSFSKAEFRKWVASPATHGGLGMNPRHATKGIEKVFHSREERGCLARGTIWRNNQETLIVVPLDKNPELQTVMKTILKPGDDEPEAPK